MSIRSVEGISTGQVQRQARGRTWPRRVARFVRTKPLGAVGALLIVLLVGTAALAPLLAPYDPLELRVDQTFVPPGGEFPLGTDNYGRDLFSRIVWGAQISLYVGILAVVFGTTTGALLGLVSGYFGGRLDFWLQRVMDSVMAFPGLVLALAIVAMLGQSITNVILAISIVIIPSASRVERSQALAIKQQMYIDAARAVGATDSRILMFHMLPNAMAPYIILATAELGGAILIEASLSFLGLGTPPPHPSWGAMLSGAAQQYAQRAPWMAIFPGLAITGAVFGFNLLGDALRDVLDPRLRRG
ncbi:MAG: ABC transporter permease [Chloroflexi bacterium]|nr:ABC transporter permease [Chloroflexota bacterium]